MQSDPISPSPTESDRLDDLLEYGILDTAPEEAFDRLTDLAASICEVPFAAIGFLDTDRQWFKSRYGFDVSQIDRRTSFGAYTILVNELFVVSDALYHPAFRENPHVTGGPKIRFYAGVPLRSRRGYRIGALFVMDTKPAVLSGLQQKAMRVLGEQVAVLLENRRCSSDLTMAVDIQRSLVEMLTKCRKLLELAGGDPSQLTN